MTASLDDFGEERNLLALPEFELWIVQLVPQSLYSLH
jgi:hypothetical protein